MRHVDVAINQAEVAHFVKEFSKVFSSNGEPSEETLNAMLLGLFRCAGLAVVAHLLGSHAQYDEATHKRLYRAINEFSDKALESVHRHVVCEIEHANGANTFDAGRN